MRLALLVMAVSSLGPAAAGLPNAAQAADASRPVFACSFKHGSVSVTVSGDRLTLRWTMPGRADAVVSGTAAQRTVLYRQDRYAGPEYQLRFVSGNRSYIVYSMAGNPTSEAEPVSGLSVLLDRTMRSDLTCTPHAEFTADLAGLSLPEDAADFSAMGLQ